MSLARSLLLRSGNAATTTAGLISVSSRPLLQLINPPQPRYGSKKKRDEKKAAKSDGAPSKADAKQLAHQREKVLLRLRQKREETKKATKLRVEAKNASKSSNFMDIETALRYLRAAEVGRSAHATTISLTMRIVAEKGAVPVNTKCRLPKPLDEERIAVFTNSSELAAEARRAGAVLVGGDDIIDQVKQGIINFDKAYATPDIVSRLNQVARILGPKGLMPNAKRGTVTHDIYNALVQASGEMTFKQEGTMLSLPVGRASFTDLEIVSNIVTVTDAIRKFMTDSSAHNKKAYIGKTVITSTTGPSIVVEV
ncbi:mitochondrial 54S ribosomal protein MRPL1 [Sugiyamaella lignohabitans]|uniref:Ribosomal protein n=1 Tax=Sugiyamaella lignohabitans TaxID=796027 RepID=A0A167EC33_9ASCO|nr:mitochondrial 54S ribosomal protein MRPL1 [Sugiyamaella lignohabitans]ANB13891.1 mitochondrial 54S ribosomal protein MRPL1 [Sugiyamaella lignohabitans]